VSDGSPYEYEGSGKGSSSKTVTVKENTAPSTLTSSYQKTLPKVDEEDENSPEKGKKGK